MLAACQIAAAAMNMDDLCATLKLETENDKFFQHVAENNLSYGTTEEFQFRKSIFERSDKEIEEINADPENTFTAGHDYMSTWTDDEFNQMLGGIVPPNTSDLEVTQLPIGQLPESIDWRTQGAVNGVKNQQRCGACWAFAATAVIEGHHAINTGQLLNFSEQQLTDCTAKGCKGGITTAPFKYAQEKGLTESKNYRYIGRQTACKESNVAKSVYVDKINWVGYNSVPQLKAAIFYGPVSVMVKADQPPFRRYKRGIVNSAACGISVNHIVAAVGYGKDSNGVDYFIIRNSWGANWGNRGYINIKAVENSPGICGCQQTNNYWVTTSSTKP